MNLTYTWEITGLGRKNSDSVQNAIVQTHWKVTGTNEDQISGSFIGATPFNIDAIDPNDFVEYENLTEEIVLSWVQNYVENDRSYMRHINEKIIKEINSKADPITIVIDGFPWKEGDEVTPPPPEE